MATIRRGCSPARSTSARRVLTRSSDVVWCRDPALASVRLRPTDTADPATALRTDWFHGTRQDRGLFASNTRVLNCPLCGNIWLFISFYGGRVGTPLLD